MYQSCLFLATNLSWDTSQLVHTAISDFQINKCLVTAAPEIRCLEEATESIRIRV